MRNHKVLATLLAFILSITPIVSATALTMAGFDGEDSNHVWSTNEFFKRMEARTGLSFTFDEYTNGEKWQAAKDAMFTSGTLPDVLFKAALSMDEQIRYSDSGQLIDLLPLLPEYAPNFWALMEKNPEWLAAITLPSGKVAALPTINTLPLQNAMWINKDWLDTFNLDMPEDWESLVAVLQVFQEKDANRNGKQDEIPLSFLGPWDLKFLSHAFGIVANDYNVFVDDAGQVRFFAEADNFIDFIQALVDLGDRGLLDKNSFSTSDSMRSITDSDATVTYGMFFGPNPYHLFPVDLGGQFSLLLPLAYDGERKYRDLFGPIFTGSFAVTSACQNPGEMLAWVDTLYTADGAAEAMSGIEGENYVWKEDDTWEFAVDLQTQSSFILYDLSVYDTGKIPWLYPVSFTSAFDTASLRETTESLLNLQDYIVNPFPYYYVLTPAQHDLIDPIQMALGSYLDESIARFVLGELDINAAEDVDAFYSGLNERGLQEFLSFWQEIYDQQRIR